MSIRLLHVVCLGVLSLSLTTPASAGDAGAPHPCASIANAAQRLACYDAAFPPAVGANSVIDLEAQKAKALQDFGLNKMQVTAREPEGEREIAPQRIQAKVIRMSNRATGERVVTLDNDQTWMLTESTSKGQLRAGDAVVIRQAALGTFMLITPGRVFLRARRLN